MGYRAKMWHKYIGEWSRDASPKKYMSKNSESDNFQVAILHLSWSLELPGKDVAWDIYLQVLFLDFHLNIDMVRYA